jgi:tetratricopeptide (TPR) repeat protein
MATILFDAGEADLAAANAVKALGLLVQIGGFDSPDVIGAHLVLFQMLLTAGQVSKGVKHLKAALYLMEILGGPRNVELSNAYHKLGTVFHGVNDLMTALKFYQEAAARESCDRLLEGMIRKSTAMVLATNGDYKTAVENEKRAFELFSILLGPSHQLTTTSDQTLKKFMALAVGYGNKMAENVQKKNEEEKANAIADEIAAEVSAEEEKKKKKNKKKKGGKK